MLSFLSNSGLADQSCRGKVGVTKASGDYACGLVVSPHAPWCQCSCPSETPGDPGGTVEQRTLLASKPVRGVGRPGDPWEASPKQAQRSQPGAGFRGEGWTVRAGQHVHSSQEQAQGDSPLLWGHLTCCGGREGRGVGASGLLQLGVLPQVHLSSVIRIFVFTLLPDN